MNESLFRGLPPEVLMVVSRLLSAAPDEEDRRLARKLEEAAGGFSLTAEEPVGSLFSGLPPFRPENRRRDPANPALYTQLDPAAVAHWFEPDGELAKALPGYEPRPEQAAMSARVAEAFSSARHLAVEAGTGVGKSMAYLVPAALWSLANKLPVVLCTSTKNLQNQLFEKDLPLVASLLPAPLRFTLVKGRSNYVCLSRLEHLVRRPEGLASQEQIPALAAAVAWAFRTDQGDLSELPLFAPETAGILEGIASDAEECRGRRCPYAQRCFLRKVRNESLASDVVITNHALYFSEPDDKPLALPRAAQVVFDEAHNLEEAVTSHFRKEFSPATLRRALRRLHTVRKAGRRSFGNGLLSNAEKFLLETNFMDGDAARSAMFVLLAAARREVEGATQSARNYFRLLANLPRKEENALRIRPETRESMPWKDLQPTLMSLQDDLWRLSDTLGLIVKVLNVSAARGGTPPAPEALPSRYVLSVDAKTVGPSSIPTDFQDSGIAASGTALAALSAARGGRVEAGTPLALAPAVFGGEADEGLAGRVSELGAMLESAAGSVNELIQALDFITSGPDDDWAYWIFLTSAGPGQRSFAGGLVAAPIDVSTFLADGLFARLDSAVLCSATLRVGGNPAFLASRLGLDRIDPDRLLQDCQGSPFDYAKQCLCAATMFLPEQTAASFPDGAFERAFADLLVRVAAETRGRMLVLFTSYRMLRNVADLAGPGFSEKGIRLLAQGDGNTRETLTNSFRDGKGPSVLFGTDSFWEGVDLIGDALTCLVIAKLPFDAVGDPLVSARSERVQATTGNAFHDYTIPNAIIKFRQGFGRLIRHKEDRGIVLVADTRLYTKGYGASFRHNLPVEPARYADADLLLSDIHSFLER